jgi:hypothetical protein
VARVAAILVLASLALVALVAPSDAQRKKRRPPAGTVEAPIRIAASGKQPNVLVDRNRTAHIVWTEEGGDAGPDLLRYCRLPRGARRCDHQAALFPDQSGPGNSPSFNEDFDGARVLRVGGQLVLLTHRYPNVVQKPDGTASSDATYAWTSSDNGATFTGPQLIGRSSLSGGALVVGDTIGVISDTKTGGTYFSTLRLGAYDGREANLAVGPDQAYSGSLARSRGRFVAAFADLGARTIVRIGPAAGGDPLDPAQWSQTAFAGEDPRLASGPDGVFLMSRRVGRPYTVRRISDAGAVGAARRVTPGGDEIFRDLFQDAGGRLYAGWIARSAPRAQIRVRGSRNGRNWSRQLVLARGPYGMSYLDLGASGRGRGVAVYQRGAPGDSEGAIFAVRFRLR